MGAVYQPKLDRRVAEPDEGRSSPDTCPYEELDLLPQSHRDLNSLEEVLKQGKARREEVLGPHR
ncbi:MAG TPA: hypothetical protein ENN53_05955 [Candidatus Acetothermia bacterium]|nr:hypothetical protein [Candidatus Acetothermia bacterium]